MKETIRNGILARGADVCGFAAIERFADAPTGFGPRDLWAACRTVIVLGVSLPKGLMQVPPRLIYGHFNALSCTAVDAIAFDAAREMERTYTCTAVPLPADGPYEYWDAARAHGRGLISMKHAAVLAGLGTMGKNAMLLHPRFGNLLTLDTILTDAELPSDALCDTGCIAGCARCVESCPVGAIGDGQVDQQRCRAHTYGHTARGFDTVDCNACRTVCPLGLGRERGTGER